MITESAFPHEGRRYVVLFESYALSGVAGGKKGNSRTIFSLREVRGNELRALAIGEWSPTKGCHAVETLEVIPVALIEKCTERHARARPTERSFDKACRPNCPLCCKAKLYEREGVGRKKPEAPDEEVEG